MNIVRACVRVYVCVCVCVCVCGRVLSLSPFLHPFTANQTWGPPPLWTPTSHIYCTSPRQMCPPMLCTPSVHTPTPSPFILLFRSGNISTCFGCRGRFSKQSCPPHDMVVQHKDYRKFVVDGVERQRLAMYITIQSLAV